MPFALRERAVRAYRPVTVRERGNGFVDTCKFCRRDSRFFRYAVDAVIASNDLLAAGVLAGRGCASVSVPKELRVIGYNDSVICECAYLALTGIDNFSAQTCG